MSDACLLIGPSTSFPQNKKQQKNVDVLCSSVMYLCFLESWIFIKKETEDFILVNYVLTDFF